jgi:hypothetical protein
MISGDQPGAGGCHDPRPSTACAPSVVVDSAKMLRDFADERELRGALYDLTGRFADTGTVLLLLAEYTAEERR